MEEIFELISVLLPISVILFLRFFFDKLAKTNSKNKTEQKNTLVERFRMAAADIEEIREIPHRIPRFIPEEESVHHKKTELFSSFTETAPGTNPESRAKAIPNRLKQLTPLQKALVMSEILGKPKSLFGL